MPARDYSNVRIHVEAGVATLTLARPARLNAMSPAMAIEVMDALESLPERGARVLVLTGEGRAFCSGADLVDEAEAPSDDMGAILETVVNPLVECLASLSIPIIAAVNGPAAGVGCSLALAADFVVAARSAYFLLAFVNVGLVPDGGATWRVPRLVGPARALRMMMLGERVKADQAAEWGLIHEAVEDEALADATRALATRLAHGPTRAYGLIRQGVRAAMESGLTDCLARERLNQMHAGETADFREGMAAFLEKRQAEFKGR